MRKTVINIAAVLTLSVSVSAYADPPALSKSLRAAVGADTVYNVWVRFKGRPAGAAAPVSERAALRRQRAGFGDTERLIDPVYIKDIERRGGRLRHEFHWDNAASFAVHASRLNDIASLPHVKSVTPVAVYVRKDADGSGLGRAAAPRSDAAAYRWHNEAVNIPLAHDYIETKGLGAPGLGTTVAFFDSGFRLGHRAFTTGRDSGGIAVAVWDFVDSDGSVADPDSVGNNWAHPYYRGDKHGTQCLALVAGYDPDSYIGAAWGAGFLLARTEDVGIEARTEEDNWAAAVVWAEKSGAQIISSSLGYRDHFDDPSEDYGYGYMDGASTVVSRAAAGAAARGVIVVNAMGNEYNNIPGTLIAPADVAGVVSVGAVDYSRRLARFSSSGPTADGRPKPDIVAPGVTVPLVDPYAAGLASYTTGNGTSFAAPIVSGIFSLILQAHPGIDASGARDRLYKSGAPAQGQTVPCEFAQGVTVTSDNLHGCGIPNALRAVMNDDEIFVKITDTLGKPVQGARLKTPAGTYATNERGAVIITAQAFDPPFDIKVIFRDETLQTLSVNTLPFVGELALGVNVDDGLRVMRNTVKRNNIVRGRYYVSPSGASRPVTAEIRAVNGRTVWSRRLQPRPDGLVEFVWDRRANGGGRVAPGVYLLTLRHGGTAVSRKLVIAN